MTMDSGDDEVLIDPLMEHIEHAFKTVLAGCDDNTFSFADVRQSLRSAYLMLDGQGSELDRAHHPYYVLHVGAHYVAQLAQQALIEGPTPEIAIEMLKRLRELQRVLERQLFGDKHRSGANVVRLEAADRRPSPVPVKADPESAA